MGIRPAAANATKKPSSAARSDSRRLIGFTFVTAVVVCLLNICTFDVESANTSSTSLSQLLRAASVSSKALHELEQERISSLQNDEPPTTTKTTEGDAPSRKNNNEAQILSKPDDNYFQMAIQDGGKYAKAVEKLVPVQLMKEYIRQHGHETLQREYDDCIQSSGGGKAETTTDFVNNNATCPYLANRKFVVGVYNCPQEAGNRLHRFMNAFFWAMATNRTFLWRYNDFKTCMEYPRRKPDEWIPPTEQKASMYCNTEGYLTTTLEGCEEVLKRADWIPSFLDWNTKLGLPPAERAAGPPQHDKWSNPYDRPDSPKLIRTNFQLEPNPVYHIQANLRNGTLSQVENWIRARGLVSHTYYFFYGMAMEALFTFQQSAVLPQSILDKQVYFVHSRHPKKNMDGSDIEPERACLKKLLENVTLSTSSSNTPLQCHFLVMTDREKALENLQQMLHNELGCTTSVVQKEKTPTISAVRTEHGPFSGLGYFQDYALARQARAGFVAFHQYPRAMIRTSSSLIRSSIEFRRRLEYYSNDEGKQQQQQRYQKLPRFPGCVNADKPLV